VRGFSLHAGVAVGGNARQTLEPRCRYITRPALATGRLALTPQGQVRYTLKTPYRDGTTHVVFEPLDFMARLAALERDSGGEPPPVVQTTASEGWAKLGLPAVRESVRHRPASSGKSATDTPRAKARFLEFAIAEGA
jgi:hypothetical protein